jgi:anti-sigma factor RsiW
MLCAEFEDRLTDYIDGALAPDANRAFAEHALRCPVCHELLIEVKSTLEACTLADVPPPSHELEARIMLATTPEAEMSCSEFEEYLTDYLDGFLPAALYHRWERSVRSCLARLSARSAPVTPISVKRWRSLLDCMKGFSRPQSAPM